MREAFTTRSFNDNCELCSYLHSSHINEHFFPALVVSYAYHADSKTLYDAHMKPKPLPIPTYQQSVYYGRHQPRNHLSNQSQQQWIEERTLWSYIVQIASAIKAVHERGLAVRMIDATKIIVTGKNRCTLIPSLFYPSP